MDSINDYIKKNLKESRLRHTYAVRDMAVRLAEQYGADREKASDAALFHDMCRGQNFTQEILNDYVREFGLDEKYIDNFGLAHSKIAVELMKRDFKITDKELLDAVSYHTTGRPEMTLLEKILFIADAIEPNRDYPGVDDLRELAFEDLDGACLASMDHTIEYIKKQDMYLDQESVAARDHLAKKKG